jgi:hypothetical protein
MWRRLVFLCCAVGVGSAAIGATTASFRATTETPVSTFSAAPFFCTSEAQTVTASADSWVDEAAGLVNQGIATNIQVQSRSSNRNRRALVSFALPAIPQHCTLQSARLRVFATSSSPNRTLQALRLASSWSELLVNWTLQPATTGAASIATSAVGWVEWNVLTQVQALYSGTNNGFLIRDAAEGANPSQTQVFSSREGLNPPQLVLTFA